MEDEDVMELDAEPIESTVRIHVNYFLFCIVPVIFLLTKIFNRLSTRISQWFFQSSEGERQRLHECSEIKSQMNSVSIVDDFVAYSKLQRRLNLVTLNLEADAQSRKLLRNDLSRMIRFVLYIIVGTVYLFTLYSYGTKEPVLILPSNWFFPIGFILSYPTGVPGGISLPIWTMITRTLISTFSS